MPLFDFQCPKCNVKLEDVRISVDDDAPKCLNCDLKMEKVFPQTGRPKVKGGTEKFH